MEVPPPPDLRGRILCFWSQRIEGAGSAPHVHSVLPDGCADIVWIDDRPPVVAGPATREVTVSLAAGARVYGARFRTGWAASSLGVSARELRDVDAPLSDLWGGSAARPLDPDRPDSAAWTTLAAVLKGELAERPEPHPSVVEGTLRIWSDPRTRVADVASELGVATRTLLRRFDAEVGYGPKTLQRIARLQRALSLARRSAHSTLGRLAHAAGYADQAHLCREVRDLTARTPSALVRVADG